MSERRRTGLLRYWTVRYSLVLFCTIMVMGTVAIAFIWLDIRHNQHGGMAEMAAEIAAAAEQEGGIMTPGPELSRRLRDMARLRDLDERIVMYILDRNGAVLQQYPPDPPEEMSQLAARLEDIRTGGPHLFALDSYRGRQPYLVAVHPLATGGGYALLALPEESMLRDITKFRIPRLIMIATVLATSWGFIYILMRRLIRPIQQAAGAAKEIVAGNYDVKLVKEHKEREVYELMASFKEMADRLRWLESLRTELLAGVTHELKTPVASISGLVQTVRDGVVEGPEAQNFLDVCLKECRRLQKMVEDLLDFNGFAANTIQVSPEPCELEKTMREVVSGWLHGPESGTVSIVIEAAEASGRLAQADPIRLEQIMINLFNNARDAMEPGGVIVVRLLADDTRHLVLVRDNGHGIPADEQPDIFEPFYRGKRKKTRVRGMGLGLPFSRLIARSMEGDLMLTASSEKGTTFTLAVPFHAEPAFVP